MQRMSGSIAGKTAMKKVIVTGGAGFIGSHTVVELFEAGYTPVVVDDFSNSQRSVIDDLRALTSADLAVYELDCTDAERFAEVFRDDGAILGVIHFAAYKSVVESVRAPLKYYANNVGSLVTLLELMREFGLEQLVFSSSCTVYGQPDALPVTESSPLRRAESPYGATKQICERILDDCVHAEQPLQAVTLRYFNPIGAHPSSRIGELPLGVPDNLVPYITQTAAGLRSSLTVFGGDYATPDGSCIRDYIHVVDLAKAHVKALAWLSTQKSVSFNEVFNIGTGAGVSVLEAVRAFEDVNQLKLNYAVGDRRPGDVEKIYANVDKAQRVLGWSARLSLRDAMHDAWNWQVALGQRSRG